MAKSEKVASDGHSAEIALFDLSVVLIADGIEPSVINLDMLRHSGIIDSNLETKEQPISTPVFSRVAFKNDLTVTVEPNRFLFEQQGDPLRESDCVSPETAERFLKAMPYLRYKAIGINPKGWLDGESPGGMISALSGEGSWVSFQNVLPNVSLKASYSYEDRQINIDVGSAKKRGKDEAEVSGFLFQVNIHRDVSEIGQSACVEHLSKILSEWQKDVSDFNQLVKKFVPEGAEA